MPRLFMAVRVPANDTFRRVLARLKGVRGVSATPPENLHYTLRFLGDVPTDTADALRAACTTADLVVAPFPVDILGTGAFPDRRRPRVVWAGCAPDAHAPFARLAAAVDALATMCGLGPRDKPFVPHLTLARIKRVDGRGEADVKALLVAEQETHYGATRTEKVILVESTLTPAGSRYADLVEVALR